MTTEKIKRKLAAILSADVKGYSRLMGEDEKGTLRTLNAYKEAMAGLIQHHGGRVVDAPGDNVLAEFGSVVDAVECAVEIQKELKTRNAELPENRKMEFRIGVNLGDVIEDGEQILGDGVNIAARLEGLSEAGGVCISGTAYDHVENKISLAYKYLGEQTVKNIAKPVRVYRVLIEPETSVSTASIWKMALPLPDKPSIAVLPFVNMSEDPGQDFLVDGITENIITALSSVPQLFVIARNSTFVYKGKAVRVQKVAEELGVQYVLEGSVVRSGDRIRVTAQLIDALKGHHLWAERYDRELKDLFALQDDVTMRILWGMRVRIMEGEQVLQGQLPPSLEVYLKFLQGIESARVLNVDSNNRARQLADECIALEPSYSGGYGLLGGVHIMDYWLGSKNPMESLDMAIKNLEKALDFKGRVLDLLGYACAMKKDYDKAIDLGEKAIAQVPNGADACIWLAQSLDFVGRREEAIPLFEKAMRLNPFPPSYYYLNFGHALRLLGRFEEASVMYKNAIQLMPNNLFAHSGLAATYALMGKEEEARAEAAEVLRINPKFSVEYMAKISPYKRQEDTDQYMQGLRKAGLK